jgi:hypothetical protein
VELAEPEVLQHRDADQAEQVLHLAVPAEGELLQEERREREAEAVGEGRAEEQGEEPPFDQSKRPAEGQDDEPRDLHDGRQVLEQHEVRHREEADPSEAGVPQHRSIVLQRFAQSPLPPIPLPAEPIERLRTFSPAHRIRYEGHPVGPPGVPHPAMHPHHYIHVLPHRVVPEAADLDQDVLAEDPERAGHDRRSAFNSPQATRPKRKPRRYSSAWVAPRKVFGGATVATPTLVIPQPLAIRTVPPAATVSAECGRMAFIIAAIANQTTYALSPCKEKTSKIPA